MLILHSASLISGEILRPVMLYLQLIDETLEAVRHFYGIVNKYLEVKLLGNSLWWPVLSNCISNSVYRFITCNELVPFFIKNKNKQKNP